jgi:hypothetical protein
MSNKVKRKMEVREGMLISQLNWLSQLSESQIKLIKGLRGLRQKANSARLVFFLFTCHFTLVCGDTNQDGDFSG